MNSTNWIWIAGIVLLVGLGWYAITSGKADAPTAISGEPTENTVTGGAIAYIGTYQSALMHTSETNGKVYTLEIKNDRTATFITDPGNDEDLIEEAGEWTAEDGTVTIRLTKRNNEALDAPVEMIFGATEERRLTLENDVEGTWGDANLTLIKTGTAEAIGDNPLVGTNWQWVKMTMNDTESVPVKPEAFIISFGTDNRFTTGTDCNQASGNYTVFGQNLTFGEIASTKMACPEMQETVYLEGLGKVASYKISGASLTLGLENGSGEMEFEKAGE